MATRTATMLAGSLETPYAQKSCIQVTIPITVAIMTLANVVIKMTGNVASTFDNLSPKLDIRPW